MPPLAGQAAPAPDPATSFVEKIPGTLVSFEMIALPAGEVTIDTPDGAKVFQIPPLLIGKTEVTWDEYDIFAFRMDLTDEQKAQGIEAKSRPSKPYGAPDFGFGHAKYPALCVTYHAGESYCEWLSEKTGRRYRLPTQAEWIHACRAGGEQQKLDKAELDARAWHWDNAEDKTHPVAKKKPNAFGLHDMLGNVVEWCSGIDGQPIAMGGSYDDDAKNIHCDSAKMQTADWNSTDPQNPKSTWWLSDGSFVGFRVVCEP